MRVIQPGRFSKPPTPGPWWAGRQGVCAVCGAVLELNGSDKPDREPGIEPDETLRVVFSCPEAHPDNRGAVVVARY